MSWKEQLWFLKMEINCLEIPGFIIGHSFKKIESGWEYSTQCSWV